MIKKVIFISAGGTGGHIFPALILSNKLKKEGYELYFITDKRGINFISSSNIFNKIFIIPASGFTGKSFINKIKSIFNLIIGFFISLFFVLKYNPKLTIGFGGYTTIPVIIASKILLKKTIIHSADTVLGLSNKVLSFFSNIICTSFDNVSNIPKVNKGKVVFTSLPIKESFYKFSKKEYCINSNINILITGGSLGASSLSIPIAVAISKLPNRIKNKLNIFHQVNVESLKQVKGIYKEHNINAIVKSFFLNTPYLLYKCNIFIGRSGASTIHELMTMKRPSILVPLIHKDRHQIINAQLLSNIGGSIIILQTDKFVDNLTSILLSLISNKSKLMVMHRKLQKLKIEKAVPKFLKLINTFMKE